MTATLLLLLACRPDPGTPVYPDFDAASAGDTGEDDDFYDGPDPWQEGEARLSLGVFYEGGSSDALPVDDVTRHYYIYDNTYTQDIDLIDRVEGYQSDIIVHAGGDWWGGGVTWDAATDLSSWTTMYVSLSSGSDGFASVELHLTGGGTEASVNAGDYGYKADGSWHHLSVPLADFAAGGADLSSVTGPFVLVGGAGSSGDELHIDNLYFTAD